MNPHFMKNLLSLNLHNSVFHYETIKGCKLCVNCSLQFLTHWQNSALNSFVLFVYISYCISTRWWYISVFLVIVHKYKDIHGDEFLNKMHFLVFLALPIIAAHVVNYCYLTAQCLQLRMSDFFCLCGVQKMPWVSTFYIECTCCFFYSSCYDSALVFLTEVSLDILRQSWFFFFCQIKTPFVI